MNKRIRNIGRASLSIFKRIILVIVTLLLIALQALTLYSVIFTASQIQWLYILINIIGYCCVISLIDKDMVSSFKLIWIIIILIFPFVGTIFFITCGDGRTFPIRKVRKINEYLSQYMVKVNDLSTVKAFDETAYKHVSVVNNGCGFYPHTNTLVKYYSDIDLKLKDLLIDLKNATKYVFIEYFIISSGKMLDALMDVLEEITSRGVEVKIIYDDFGSKRGFKEKDLKRIKTMSPNLIITKFAPLGVSLNLAVNYRDHRKIVVIDGKIGYVGGDNIADEYANYITRFGKWRDNAIRMEGEAVDNLIFMFAETWYLSTKHKLEMNNYRTGYSVKTDNLVFPYDDGPTDSKNPAADLYTSMIQNAKKYIYISTPYFIIDQDFINNLILASKSGVDVKILIPGIPDKKTVYILTQAHFGKLLREGVKIYKYTPGFNHAKNFICDDKYATIGTVNVDYRSLYLHFENGVYIVNDETVNKLKQDFVKDIEQSTELTYEEWKKRKWYIKIYEFILKVFSTLM